MILLLQGYRDPIERHHLFPRKYLETLEITDLREVNQIANYAFIEWGENAKISDKSPAEYMPAYLERFSKDDLKEMYYLHALPENWENLPYQEFLSKRRELIANIIKKGYQCLDNKKHLIQEEIKQDLNEIIRGGESGSVEFKSTFRINLHTNEIDSRMELGVLKTIAGFLNLKGGTLFVGVSDDKELLGIEIDRFENEDKMSLHLSNLIRDRIGSQFSLYIQPHFEDFNGGRVFIIECLPSKSPVFVKDGKEEKFFIRTGSSTTQLSPKQTQEFVTQRFG